MSDLIERLKNLASWLDQCAQAYEDISYHHQAEDVGEAIAALEAAEQREIELLGAASEESEHVEFLKARLQKAESYADHLFNERKRLDAALADIKNLRPDYTYPEKYVSDVRIIIEKAKAGQ